MKFFLFTASAQIITTLTIPIHLHEFYSYENAFIAFLRVRYLNRRLMKGSEYNNGFAVHGAMINAALELVCRCYEVSMHSSLLGELNNLLCQRRDLRIARVEHSHSYWRTMFSLRVK